jgi:hypothetical protein
MLSDSAELEFVSVGRTKLDGVPPVLAAPGLFGVPSRRTTTCQETSPCNCPV